MVKEDIEKLMQGDLFPETIIHPELIETHISWVIMGNQFVYKIKKPVQYSFLDFSTLEKRKYYCERELELNKRLTKNIYVDVQPVISDNDHLMIGGKGGKITDYAVRMHKMDRTKQMDILLKNNQVDVADIKRLAEKIGDFHQQAVVIYDKDMADIRTKFNDLEGEKDFLKTYLSPASGQLIARAISTSGQFLQNNAQHISSRLRAGFFRDGHGDLHARNIFLLPEPEPFDCIEFNDDYRRIDVLNEIAFLCMDLDAFGRQDLADSFYEFYNHATGFPVTENDRQLFIYYKSYRANIRAKVNSLRARSTTDSEERKWYISETGRYLQLMKNYLQQVSG